MSREERRCSPSSSRHLQVPYIARRLLCQSQWLQLYSPSHSSPVSPSGCHAWSTYLPAHVPPAGARRLLTSSCPRSWKQRPRMRRKPLSCVPSGCLPSGLRSRLAREFAAKAGSCAAALENADSDSLLGLVGAAWVQLCNHRTLSTTTVSSSKRSRPSLNRPTASQIASASWPAPRCR